MRLAVPIAIVALAAALLAGCGGSSGDDSSSAGSTTAPEAGSSNAPAGASAQVCAARGAGVRDVRVTGLSCEQGDVTIAAWQRLGSCEPAAGATRSGCRAGPYRCLSVMTGRGRNVSCSRPGRSVVFTVEN
jgi:predicted small secreted protein